MAELRVTPSQGGRRVGPGRTHADQRGEHLAAASADDGVRDLVLGDSRHAEHERGVGVHLDGAAADGSGAEPLQPPWLPPPAAPARGWGRASPRRSRTAPWHCSAPRGSLPASAGPDPGTAPTGAARAGPGRRRAPPAARPAPRPRPPCPADAAALGRGGAGQRALSSSPHPALLPHREPHALLPSLSGPPWSDGAVFLAGHFTAPRTIKRFRNSGFCGYSRQGTIAAEPYGGLPASMHDSAVTGQVCIPPLSPGGAHVTHSGL